MSTILVVDDRAVNRQFLSMLMGYAGHRVVEAADGGAALEATALYRQALASERGYAGM
jgi:CheY-like chemotaxis protein